MGPMSKYSENPEDGAENFRWRNQVKTPKRKMADAHHWSSSKKVKRTLVQHPSNIRFEPLSLYNRYKILEMLNEDNNDYVYLVFSGGTVACHELGYTTKFPL